MHHDKPYISKKCVNFGNYDIQNIDKYAAQWIRFLKILICQTFSVHTSILKDCKLTSLPISKGKLWMRVLEMSMSVMLIMFPISEGITWTFVPFIFSVSSAKLWHCVSFRAVRHYFSHRNNILKFYKLDLSKVFRLLKVVITLCRPLWRCWQDQDSCWCWAPPEPYSRMKKGWGKFQKSCC